MQFHDTLELSSSHTANNLKILALFLRCPESSEKEEDEKKPFIFNNFLCLIQFSVSFNTFLLAF